MFNVRTIAALLVLGAMVIPANAQETNRFKQYLGETVMSVRATPDPVQKRAILDRSLGNLSTAIDRIKSAGLVSADEMRGMAALESTVMEKRDELAGVNGFERVPDRQLDLFANYVVQDVEQAAQTVTISLIAALLIVIILVLVA